MIMRDHVAMMLLGIFAIIIFLSAIEGKSKMNCKFFHSKYLFKEMDNGGLHKAIVRS